MAGELFDVTARKAHQWTMVVLVAASVLLGQAWGWLPLLVAGLVMIAGRFWWPADVVRQFTWRFLEPRGILRRAERVEDHETRRIARVMGGAVWLLAAGLLLLHLAIAAYALALLIAVMVVLDAALDFCALCFVFLHLDRRGLLPPTLRHAED